MNSLTFEMICNQLKLRHPLLNISHFTVNQSGWANLVIEADDTWIFRIPRNQPAKDKIEAEKYILDKLNKLKVNYRIPRYFHVSMEEDLSYVLYKKVQGVFIDKDWINNANQPVLELLASKLAEFLQTLHSLSCPNINLSLNVWNSKRWVSLRDEVTIKAKDILSLTQVNSVIHLIDDIASFHAEISPFYCPIHGDFSEDHILVDTSNEYNLGVIDFGDVEIGDPAYDFAGLALSFGYEFMELVRKKYNRQLGPYFAYRVQAYLKKAYVHELLYAIETNNLSRVRKLKTFF